MKFSGSVSLHGQLHILVKDEKNNIKHDLTVPNLVVDAGLAFIASRMAGTSSSVMSHMAVGSSSTAASSGQTDLVSILGSRVSLTSGTASTNTMTYIATFSAGVSTGAITEAGVFNASSSGTMLCRSVFSTINKAAGDSMTITWTITLS